MCRNSKPQELKSWAVSLDGEHWSYINALSRGKAKSEWMLQLDIDIEYTSIKCRLNGLPYTSESFRNNANYRGIDFAYCGMAVKVGEWYGVITGHTSSANLYVLVTSGKMKGHVRACHPNSKIEYFDKKGKSIMKF